MRLFGYRKVSWKSRAHFFAAAAQLMRRILVEHARKRGAAKRGGHATHVLFDDGAYASSPSEVDLIGLHEALNRLEAEDAQLCRIVELRYFGGLGTEETAEVLGVSPSTVKRGWHVARLFLRRELARVVEPARR